MKTRVLRLVKPTTWEVQVPKEEPFSLCIYGGFIEKEIAKATYSLGMLDINDLIYTEEHNHGDHYDRGCHMVITQVTKISDSVFIRLSQRVRLREEKGFGIVCDGKVAHYVNKTGFEILKLIKERKKIRLIDISNVTGIPTGAVATFLEQLALFGVVEMAER